MTDMDVSNRDILVNMSVGRLLLISGYIPDLPFCQTLEELAEYDKFTHLDEKIAIAGEIGDLSAVKRLIELGAQNLDGCMMSAVSGNHVCVIEFLLENGARNVNNCLKYAASLDNIKIVKLMLNHGAKRKSVVLAATVAERDRRLETMNALMQLLEI